MTLKTAVKQVDTEEVGEYFINSEVVKTATKPGLRILDSPRVRGGGGPPAPANSPVGKSTVTQESSRSDTKPSKSAAARSNESKPSSKGRVRYVEQSRLDAELAGLRKLSDAASQGDTVALDKLRTALDTCPHIWRRLADLQISIECRMADLVAQKDLLRLEAIRKRSAELRQELVASGNTMIVKMAASRYVSCWVFAQFLELTFMTSTVPQPCLKLLVQAERRIAIAMRAYTHARLAEAQLQRLQSPNTK